MFGQKRDTSKAEEKLRNMQLIKIFNVFTEEKILFGNTQSDFLKMHYSKFKRY